MQDILHQYPCSTNTPSVFHVQMVNQYPDSHQIEIKLPDPSATRSQTSTILCDACIIGESLSASTESGFLETYHKLQLVDLNNHRTYFRVC
jgi:hypothetical protein